MRANVRILAILLVLSVFFIPMVSAYQIFTVIQDDTTSDFNATPPSFKWTESCSVNIELLATATHSTSFTLNNKYFMPTNNLLSFGIPTYLSNIVCRAQGNASGTLSDSNDFFTPRTRTQSSATSTDTWARAYYDCEPDSDSLIIYNQTNVLDAEGHFPFHYIRRTGGYCQVGSAGSLPALATQLINIISELEIGYFTDCGSDLNLAEISGQSTTCDPNRFFGDTWWSMSPFNSGPSGLVNITVTEQEFVPSGGAFAVLTCFTNKIYLWDTVINATTEIGTSVPFTSEQTLIPNRDYFLFMGSNCTGNSNAGTPSTLGYNHTDYSISIFAFEPDFVCSEFSECADNLRFRNCTDTFGVVPDLIEFETCVIIELENATFGFEDFFLSNGLICVPDYDAFADINPFGQGCFYIPTPQNKSRKIPVNWSLGETATTVPRDFITMTDEWSTEGFLSLKMWYIPPSLGEPTSLTTCGNLSSGRIPSLANTNFTNIILEQNITFPAANMLLRFDTRACHNITEKHGDVTEPFIFGLDNRTRCQRECYGDCNRPPWIQPSNFRILLFNSTSGEFVVDYFSNADWSESTRNIDLTNAGLSANQNYTLRIAIDNDDVYSKTPQCVLFDNMRYSVIEFPLECETRCFGLTFEEAKQTKDGFCVLVESPLSRNCLEEDEDIASFDLCERICLENDDEMIPTTDCIPLFAPEYDLLENSPRCAEVISEEANETLTITPIASTSAIIDMILGFLLTPIFIFFGIATIISTITTIKTKHWEAGAVAFSFMLLMGSLIRLPNSTSPIIPEFITITIIAGVALLIGAKIKGFGMGSGG